MHDSTTVQNNIIYDNKMRFLNHIAELLILCTIALTTVTGLKPTTFHNQTLLAKSTQEGTTSMTTTSSQELKHHNQTSLKSKYDGGPSWLLNVPLGWGSHHAAHSIQRHNDSSTNDSNFGQAYLQRFDEFVELAFDDGEAVDAIEHFFWGRTNGLVLELGAGDGLPSTASVSYPLEKRLGWRRILVEGNPKFQEILRDQSSEALTVAAAICDTASNVHYSTLPMVGGVIEFMGPIALQKFHSTIYTSTTPPGNVSLVNWTDPTISSLVEVVPCVPLHTLLKTAKTKHVNLFVLDVEGAELTVLQTVNWDDVVFDVLCVELEDISRYKGYTETVREYLLSKGYINVTGVVGRNMWFVHRSFQPNPKPGMDPNCYNRHRKRPRKTLWERIFFWYKLEPQCMSEPYVKDN